MTLLIKLKSYFLTLVGMLFLAILVLLGVFLNSNHEAKKGSIDKKELKKTLSSLSDERLQSMYKAGQEILEWNQLLSNMGSDVVAELIKGKGIAHKINHTPDADAYDHNSHSQYYYHAHRHKESGHFHLFIRQGGMPEDIKPCFYHETNTTMNEQDTFSHLIAISLSNEGAPVKLFTTNRWVTGEDWYRSEDICQMIDLFKMEETHPSWVTNQWLTMIVRLFYPQIHELISEREEVLKKHAKGKILTEVLSDYSVDILSEKPISIETQLEVLEELIEEREINNLPQ